MTHKDLDRYTRLTLYTGSRRDCEAFARAFGLCVVEEM